MDFQTWIMENNDFDAAPQPEDDFRAQQQPPQQRPQPVSSGMTLTAQEVEMLRDIVNDDPYSWDSRQFEKKYPPAFLMKLRALGLYNPEL